MFITLTNLGGRKVRINTDQIIRYSTGDNAYPDIDSDKYIAVTDVVTIDRILLVKESPEQIDEILRTSYITVYERK